MASQCIEYSILGNIPSYLVTQSYDTNGTLASFSRFLRIPVRTFPFIAFASTSVQMKSKTLQLTALL